MLILVPIYVNVCLLYIKVNVYALNVERQAVAYLHSLGLIHCDLCPENWLFERKLEETTNMSDLRLVALKELLNRGLKQRFTTENLLETSVFIHSYSFLLIFIDF